MNISAGGGDCKSGCSIPDSKVQVAHMGPTWVLSAPGGPHVAPNEPCNRGCSQCRLTLNGRSWNISINVSARHSSKSLHSIIAVAHGVDYSRLTPQQDRLIISDSIALLISSKASHEIVTTRCTFLCILGYSSFSVGHLFSKIYNDSVIILKHNC